MRLKLTILLTQLCFWAVLLAPGRAQAQSVDQNWKTPGDIQTTCTSEITQINDVLANPSLSPEERAQWLAYRKMVEITSSLVQANTPVPVALADAKKQVTLLLESDKDLASVPLGELDRLSERLVEQMTVVDVQPAVAH